MSSLDARRAPPRSGVTYNTPYMHQLHRKYIFFMSGFFLSLNLTKSTQQTL